MKYNIKWPYMGREDKRQPPRLCTEEEWYSLPKQFGLHPSHPFLHGNWGYDACNHNHGVWMTTKHHTRVHWKRQSVREELEEWGW